MFGARESTVGKRVWQTSALVSTMTTLNRDAVPIGDDIESMEESRVDIETGNQEEESSESEISKVETNLKNPGSRAEQEREDCGHAVYRNWCVVCVGGRRMRTNYSTGSL